MKMEGSSKCGQEKKTDESSSETPMWRISQLGQHHKLQPVYSLEKEEGHYKTKKFTVSLLFGKETYIGCGSNKKQAKQNAASNALKNTLLTMPPVNKKKSSINSHAYTATVKLNSMAMALGKQVTYAVTRKDYDRKCLYNSQQHHLLGAFDPPKHVIGDFYEPIEKYNPSITSFYNGISHCVLPQIPVVFTVCVTVGDQKYFGEGQSHQAARHDAAFKAIMSLQQDELNVLAAKKNQAGQDNKASKIGKGEDSKSPVALLHEEALPRNMSVVFNTKSEQGPLHIRQYVMDVEVGHFVDGKLDEKSLHFTSTGSGSTKKIAKQNAATLVLEKMKDLPPRVKKVPKMRNPGTKSSLVKEKPSPTTSNLHPVSRLLQITQAKKIKEPSYITIEENAEKYTPNKFIIQCTLEDKSVKGQGRNKKEAKRAAAEAMLECLGFNRNPETTVPNFNLVPLKTSLKGDKTSESSPRSKHLQVKFADD